MKLISTLSALLFLSINAFSANIAFIGDVNFTGRISDAIVKDGISWPFEKVAKELSGADFTVANLESPLGVGGYKYCPKRVYFKADPNYADALCLAGIDLVSLANNHALDYGPEVLEQTKQELTKRGILYAGIVENNSHINKPVIVEINKTKIGFLSFCNACPQEFAPTNVTMGVSVGYSKTMVTQIKQLKPKVDFVVVMPHWGTEYAGPDINQKRQAQKAVDAGADLVIGHHPHVVQQAVKIGDSIVAYSLGNFLFPMRWETSMDSMILNVLLEKGRSIQWNYLPVSLENNRPEILQPWLKGWNTEKEARISYIVHNEYQFEKERANDRRWTAEKFVERLGR